MLKHFPFRNLLPAMVVLAFAMTMAGCSTQKNTAKEKFIVGNFLRVIS